MISVFPYCYQQLRFIFQSFNVALDNAIGLRTTYRSTG